MRRCRADEHHVRAEAVARAHRPVNGRVAARRAGSAPGGFPVPRASTASLSAMKTRSYAEASDSDLVGCPAGIAEPPRPRGRAAPLEPVDRTLGSRRAVFQHHDDRRRGGRDGAGPGDPEGRRGGAGSASRRTRGGRPWTPGTRGVPAPFAEGRCVRAGSRRSGRRAERKRQRSWPTGDASSSRNCRS